MPKSQKKKTKASHGEMEEMFELWGLSDEAVSVLAMERFTHKSAVLVMDLSDIDALELARGDKAILRAKVRKYQQDNGGGPLCEGRDVTPGQVRGPLEGRYDGASVAHQSPRLLQDIVCQDSGPEISDLLRGLREQQHKGTSALRIVDFVTAAAVAEEEVALGGGLTLKLPQTKPKLDKVTPAHWIVANSRIMGVLMDTRPVGFTETAYLKYTQMVGELAARFTWQSVLVFDDEYRQRQAAEGFPWGTDAPHLSTVVLRDRAAAAPVATNTARQKGGRSGQRPVGPSGREVCLQYNRGQCMYGARCRMEHVCATCGKEHPAREHRDDLPTSAGGKLGATA